MRTVRLGDVVDIQLGKMLSPASKTGLRPMPYLRNANVQWDRFDLGEVHEMDFDVREEQKFLLRPGDVLVCEGGEPGRAAVWTGAIVPCLYQKALHRLRPISDAVDPQYLVYRLWFAAHRGELVDGQAKSTIAHLPAIRLAELMIQIPPIDEQRRVATSITNQFAIVETARSKASQRAAFTQSVREAVLRQAFETSDESWAFQRLSSLCEFISDGTHQPPQFAPDGVAFLFIRNIVGGRIDFSDCRFVSHEAWAELTRRRRPLPGDVLFSAVGSFGIAVVVDTDRPFTFQRHIAHLRLRRDVAIPQFVSAYLNSPQGRKQSASVALGGAQRTVTLRSLGEFQIPLPPLREQALVMATLNERLAMIDTMAVASEAESEAVGALPAALLRSAFDERGV